MARTISKEEIKRIYALASGLEMVERGSEEDPLHVLVCGITGKTSVRELTAMEFSAVEHELLDRMRLKNRQALSAPKRKSAPSSPPGMMTAQQQRLAWRLVYRLRELDLNPDSAAVGERMKGAIAKVLGMQVSVKNPFVWVTFDQGRQLIEALKRYVRSAEKKAGGSL